MSVEIPDTLGPGDPGSDSAPGSRTILTAIALTLVGLFVVGVLSRQPGAEKATTLADEETAISIPRLDDPLDWRADEVGSTWPQGLVEFEGNVYFFARSGPGSPLEVATGLEAWLLVDGVTWKTLGTVIEPPNVIHTVSATPRGLVAAGSKDGNAVHLWSSTDGVEWVESDIPEMPPQSGYLRSWAQAVGGTDDVTVLFTSAQGDMGALLRDVLPAELEDEDGNPPLNVGWGGPPWTVNVFGPLGLTAFSATAEDLGLSEAEAQALLGGIGPLTTTAWTSTDGQAWTRADIGIQYVNTVFEVGGQLMVSGYGGGNETWTSPDGFDWEPVAGEGGLEHLTPWRDGFVATRQQFSSPDIAYSEDRITWEPFGVDAYLADGFSWWFQTLAAGEGGLGAVITGYDDTEFVGGDLQPAVLEKDGYTLTADRLGGPVVLKEGDDVLLSLVTYSSHIHDEVAVDFRARTVTFLHPDSFEPLVAFTFDEIEQAETDAIGNGQFMLEEQLVAFTADGSTWSVESVSETFGEDAFVNLLTVTDNQVVAVVTHSTNRFGAVPELPTVVIWTAVIP